MDAYNGWFERELLHRNQHASPFLQYDNSCVLLTNAVHPLEDHHSHPIRIPIHSHVMHSPRRVPLHEWGGDLPGYLPGNLPRDVPGYLPGDAPGDLPGNLPGDFPGDFPSDVPTWEIQLYDTRVVRVGEQDAFVGTL